MYMYVYVHVHVLTLAPPILHGLWTLYTIHTDGFSVYKHPPSIVTPPITSAHGCFLVTVRYSYMYVYKMYLSDHQNLKD